MTVSDRITHLRQGFRLRQDYGGTSREHREIELRMTPAVASAYAKAMADKKAMAGKIDEYDLRKTGKQWLSFWVLFFFPVSCDNLGLYVRGDQLVVAQ